MLIGRQALQFLDVLVVRGDDLSDFILDFLAPAVLSGRQHHAILAIPQSLLRILQLERMHIWHICSQLLFLGRFHFRKWYLAWSLKCCGGKCTAWCGLDYLWQGHVLLSLTCILAWLILILLLYAHLERVLCGLHIHATSKSHIIIRGHIWSHRLPEKGLRLRGWWKWLVRYGLIKLNVHLFSPFLETFEHRSFSSLRLVPSLEAYLMLLMIWIKLFRLGCGKLVT